MSNFNKIGGFAPVPNAHGPRNQQQQQPNSLNGTVRSAVWGKTQAAVGESVPFSIKFNRLPMTKNIVIEILYNQQGIPPRVVGVPLIIPAAGLDAGGRWTAMQLGPGWFTFRVRIDNQIFVSNELGVGTAVAQVMHRYTRDGFDR